jgi:Protein of unknown function (DUF3795)
MLAGAACQMMSACGVMCSDCPAYQGASKGPAHQQQTVEAWHRIYGLNEGPARISCGGCLGPDQELFHTMGRCQARRCCRKKGLHSCAECTEVACPDLEHAQAVWDSVPDLASRLSAADFDRYARPYCGHRERLTAARVARRSSASSGGAV